MLEGVAEELVLDQVLEALLDQVLGELLDHSVELDHAVEVDHSVEEVVVGATEVEVEDQVEEVEEGSTEEEVGLALQRLVLLERLRFAIASWPRRP